MFCWEWREGIAVIPQVIAVEGQYFFFFGWWFFNLLLVRECWLTHNVQLWISCEELWGGNIDCMEIHSNPVYNLFWSFCPSSSLGRQRKNHKTVTCYHVCGYGIAHCSPLSIISIPEIHISAPGQPRKPIHVLNWCLEAVRNWMKRMKKNGIESQWFFWIHLFSIYCSS